MADTTEKLLIKWRAHIGDKVQRFGSSEVCGHHAIHLLGKHSKDKQKQLKI